MVDNLILMFLLAPLMVLSWWWLIRLVNWSAGVQLREVTKTIYSNPIAAAIYRTAVIYTIAQLVIAAYGRWV